MKFSSWEGKETEFAAGSAPNTIGPAPVWYVEELYSGLGTVEYYPSVYLGEEPVDRTWLKNARRFSVNFSGFTFQVGVRIALGK